MSPGCAKHVSKAVAESPSLRRFKRCGTWGRGLVLALPVLREWLDLILLETFSNLNYSMFFFLFCVHPLEGKPAKNQHPAALLLRLLGIAELGFVPVYLSHLRTGHKVCLQAAPSLERG